jgi:NAD(P)-dependent dehydrogenase (short-subunit alcohol dehydrogenase family)
VSGATQKVLDLEDSAALADFLSSNSPADYYGVIHLSSPPYTSGFVSDDLETTRRHLWHGVEVPLQLARWARQDGSAIKRIILLGSHAGNKHPEPRAGAYSLAKMTMENLVSLLAADMGTHNATINIVCPSSLDVNDTPKSGTAAVPTGHVTNAADVANVIQFLLSDESAQINGANIAVDGGLP